MFPTDPDRDEQLVFVDYVFHYLPQLLTAEEQLAEGLAQPMLMFESGSNASLVGLQRLMADTDQLAVLRAARLFPEEVEGQGIRSRWVGFRRAVAQRLVNERADALDIARCPSCSRVLNTPQAQQCLVCGEDWHDG